MERQKTRVLIGDRSRDFCELLRAANSSEPDLEVTGIAYDGSAVLKLAPSAQPDVIILDLFLPYLDGLGVVEQLKRTQTEARPKIIMMSASGEEKIVRLALSAADYFMVKPVDLRALGHRIRQPADTNCAPPANGTPAITTPHRHKNKVSGFWWKAHQGLEAGANQVAVTCCQERRRMALPVGRRWQPCP